MARRRKSNPRKPAQPINREEAFSLARDGGLLLRFHDGREGVHPAFGAPLAAGVYAVGMRACEGALALASAGLCRLERREGFDPPATVSTLPADVIVGDSHGA